MGVDGARRRRTVHITPHVWVSSHGYPPRGSRHTAPQLFT
jgi:hypothetical protein